MTCLTKFSYENEMINNHKDKHDMQSLKIALKRSMRLKNEVIARMLGRQYVSLLGNRHVRIDFRYGN